MKIVHEIYGTPQTTLSGQAYSCRIDEPPTWQGMRMEILICDVSKGHIEGDAIFIEGDSKAIRLAFESVLRQMTMYEKLERERFETRAAGFVQCSKCSRWADPFAEWHGDGEGNACILPQDQKC